MGGVEPHLRPVGCHPSSACKWPCLPAARGGDTPLPHASPPSHHVHFFNSADLQLSLLAMSSWRLGRAPPVCGSLWTKKWWRWHLMMQSPRHAGSLGEEACNRPCCTTSQWVLHWAAGGGSNGMPRWPALARALTLKDPTTCACCRAQAVQPTTPAAARRRKEVRKGGAVDQHVRLCALV